MREKEACNWEIDQVRSPFWIDRTASIWWQGRLIRPCFSGVSNQAVADKLPRAPFLGGLFRRPGPNAPGKVPFDILGQGSNPKQHGLGDVSLPSGGFWDFHPDPLERILYRISI